MVLNLDDIGYAVQRVEKDLNSFAESVKYVQECEDIIDRYKNLTNSFELLKFVMSQQQVR